MFVCMFFVVCSVLIHLFDFILIIWHTLLNVAGVQFRAVKDQLNQTCSFSTRAKAGQLRLVV